MFKLMLNFCEFDFILALFESLLFEAVGRTINPVNGAIGLLSTGNWHLCQAGVRTVLAGGTPNVIANVSTIPETFATSGLSMMIENKIPTNFMDEQSFMSFRCSDDEEPKLLNLLV